MRQTPVVGLAVLLVVLLAGCSTASGRPADVGANRDNTLSSPECVVTAKLIPTCGAWWGIAPDVFSGTLPVRAVARAEERMGRRADVVHSYHRGGELFPTPAEREIAKGPRLLLINWKPSMSHTWAEVARGTVDRRIDVLARHITQTFPGRFFLTIHHEPENDVREGGGYSAQDYAAMFRHVVTRLRARGVTNAVTVMTYMGAPNWASKPWFEQLYPGDDVVDWIGLDPYADGRVHDFAGLVDKTRPDHPQWPGFYRWIQSRHPGKPIMMAEWGAFERYGVPRFKRDFYESVKRQIYQYPQVKALVYFDSPLAPRGDTRFDTTPGAAKAFSELANQRHFTSTRVPVG